MTAIGMIAIVLLIGAALGAALIVAPMIDEAAADIVRILRRRHD